MTRDEFEQLSVEYALGALGGPELTRFEEYLRIASPDELAHLRDLVATASLLPLALDRQTPPPRVKENLLEKTRISARAASAVEDRPQRGAPLPAQPKRTWLWAGITGVAIIMIAGFSVMMINLLGTVEKQNTQLAAANKHTLDLNRELIALKDELSRKEEMLKILSSRRIEITIMNGLKVNPVGYGKILWDPERGTAILQVSKLPPLPHDKDYQLWVIKGKTPISAGVFSVADTSAFFFKIDPLTVVNPREIAAFAVTLEPKGGVPAPTGEMYLAGSPRL